MAMKQKSADSWDRVGLKKERYYALVVLMAQENRPSPANANDAKLEEAGVKPISLEEAKKVLHKLGRDDLFKRWILKEATAKK